ncbi:MAG: hydrogenase expression/formation protein HypE [Chloroflexi bacterium]|nr:hydrogenase expression/formation protein HypE [Chloroflexota bacterium]
MTDEILLGHGSGGRLSNRLIQEVLISAFGNPILNKMDDSAVFDLNGRIAFTTDSYVVSPIFFPGGDIGKLAICGTVNDLSMNGAKPLYLSNALIIEEGLPISDLKKIVASMKEAAEEAGIKIVTGDVKVVNNGKADKIFINTTGVGIIPEAVNISSSNAKPGDKIILSGTIGDHGMTIMTEREGLGMAGNLQSDCAPLNRLVADMLIVSKEIHCMRDPTRGGIAATLNELSKMSQVSIIIEEEKIPVKNEVRAACELLGLDVLYVANEGKLLAIVPAEHAENILTVMKRSKYGHEAVIIGEVKNGNAGRVILKTFLGSHRIVDMPLGELLPRIC